VGAVSRCEYVGIRETNIKTIPGESHSEKGETMNLSTIGALKIVNPACVIHYRCPQGRMAR